MSDIQRSVTRLAVCFLLASAVAFAFACGDMTRESAGGQAGSLHGTTTTDTYFQSVVALKFAGMSSDGSFCTGTWVAPQTILTSAHCVSLIGSSCGPLFNFDLAQVVFTNSGDAHAAASGSPGVTIYNVDGISVHPLAFSADFSKCVQPGPDGGGGDPNNCTSVSGTANDRGHDMALIHFAVPFGAPLPSATPRIKVVTDMTTSTGDAFYTQFSSLYTLHQSIPWTDFSVGHPNYTLVGFGVDDLGSILLRMQGIGTYSNTLPWVYSFSDSLVNCAGSYGTRPSQVMAVGRTQDAGLYNGVTVDHGDSGGPVLVKGGTLPVGIPELPTGQWYELGTLGGGLTGTCANYTYGVVDASECTVGYAPTFLNAAADGGGAQSNGDWLDHRLVDFDGDGFLDWEDHCPGIPTASNDDSNFDEQYALVRGGADAYYTTTWQYADAHTPTVSDVQYNPAYVAAWHQAFPGDACDGLARSPTAPAYTFANNEIGPCTSMQVIQGGGQLHFVYSDAGSCPPLLSSGLHTNGTIGGTYGDAPKTTGQAQPAFCNCPLFDPSSPMFCTQDVYQCIATCNSPTYGCFVAQDNLFPYPPQFGDAWVEMTQRNPSNGSNAPYGVLSTVHQDPSFFNSTYSPTGYAPSQWNFRVDYPSSNNAAGMIWSLQQSFSPISAYDSWNGIHQTEFNLWYNHNDSYHGTNVVKTNGVVAYSVPTNILLYVPIWLQVERPVNLEAPWALVGLGPSQAEVMQVDTTGQHLLPDGMLTSAAIGVLIPTASSAADLLYADDLVAGSLGKRGPRMALTLVPGTSGVMGALQYRGSYQVDGAMSGATPDTTAIIARSFSSKMDTLYSLRSGASMKIVAQSLATAFQASPTTTETTYTITGAIPSSPVAMVYNANEGVLFIADEVPAGSAKQLRLLRVSPLGFSQELWRLFPDTAPSKVYLSVGAQGETVMTLSTTFGAEAVSFDGYGTPLRSALRGTGLTLNGPAIMSTAGLSWGSHPAAGGPFSVSLTAAPTMSASLCGAPWMKTHALGSPPTAPVMANAAAICPP